MLKKEEAILKSLDTRDKAEAKENTKSTIKVSSRAPISNITNSTISVAEVLSNSVKASNVPIGRSSFLNNSSPILSPSKYFPEG